MLSHKRCSKRFWPVLLLAAGSVWLVPRSAQAFEREWHLGAGLGGALPSGGYELGPALEAYAAYGISDVFDVRLELAGSRHGFEEAPSVNVFSGAAGLAYKIDIIQWVPWFGVMGGYYLKGSGSDPLGDLPGDAPSVGVNVGIDYTLTREIGLGLSFREDFMLVDGGNMSLLFLRGEYRFGW